MTNKILFTSIFILIVSIGVGQTISKKTKEFAHEFLWKDGRFHNLFENFESSAYLVQSIGSKKFDSICIKIYVFKALVGHSQPLILIEKIYKNNKSDYAVIGTKGGLNDMETIFLFFFKYPFPDRVKDQCYEFLIANNVYSSYSTPTQFYEDSLFNEHR